MARSKHKVRTTVVVVLASIFCLGLAAGVMAILKERPRAVSEEQLHEAMRLPRKKMDLSPLAQLKVASDGVLARDIERYRIRMKRFPTTLEDLLREPPDLQPGELWDGPYVTRQGILEDPWDQPLRYASPGVHNVESYDLWSIGPDGLDDTPDDVANW